MARREKWNLEVDYCISPRYDGSRSPLICRITAEQLKQVAPELKSQRESYHKIITSRASQYPYLFLLGSHSFYISAQGEVFLSCTSRIKIGSLRQDSFKDIWMHSAQIKNIRRLKLNDFQCSGCKHLLYCCWDPGLAWLEHGDFTASPREICRLTEIALRASHLPSGRKVPP